MALNILLFFTMAVCASLHEGFGLPAMGQSDSGHMDSTHKVRTKRCSCNNQLDSECHYFCHLDIIWVNTPSKTTVYGLGSPLTRRRRSTGRCLCANLSDRTCKSFCLQSPGTHATMVNPSANQNALADKPKQLDSEFPTSQSSSAFDGSDVLLIQETSPGAPSDALTFLRNLVKAKVKSMERAGRLKQRGSRARKPGYT